MTSELLPYSDPLIDLLKDPNLNKEKDKTQELITFINEIEDSKIKSWCIESFEILRDLEKIEVKIHNWEFQTLDFNLSQSLILNEEDFKKRKFNSELAKRVSTSCLDLHEIINQLNIEIDELNHFNHVLPPLQRISDPGTILTELSLRVIKLKNQVTDEISIHYSKARLVNIGIDLENLIYNEEEMEEQDDEDDGITGETVLNYKTFINNLLQQLNDCVSSGDTIGAMECISVVNDVEKMFESMKLQKLENRQKRERKILPSHFANIDDIIEEFEPIDNVSPSSSTMTCDDTLYGEDDNEEADEADEEDPETYITNQSLSTVKIDQRRKRRLNNTQGSRLSMNLEDSSLHRTTITEKLPFLMTAFEDARATEEELKEYIASPVKKGPTKKKRTSNSYTKKMRTKSKLSEQLLNELDENADEYNDDLALKKTTSSSSTATESTTLTSTSTSTSSYMTAPLSMAAGQVPHLPSSTPSPSSGIHIHPQPMLNSLPKPYFQHSLLSSFFKPQIKEPIIIDPSSLTLSNDRNDDSNTTTIVVGNIESSEDKGIPSSTNFENTIITATTVTDKILKYRKEEDSKDLTLSPQKLTAIQLGAGRVKETVKEIEEQLPSDIKPPSPLKVTNDQNARFSNASTGFNAPFQLGRFWGSNNLSKPINNKLLNNNKPTAASDFSFHDIDNLID